MGSENIENALKSLNIKILIYIAWFLVFVFITFVQYMLSMHIKVNILT